MAVTVAVVMVMGAGEAEGNKCAEQADQER
jgi:hypothetical protein